MRAFWLSVALSGWKPVPLEINGIRGGRGVSLFFAVIGAFLFPLVSFPMVRFYSASASPPKQREQKSQRTWRNNAREALGRRRHRRGGMNVAASSFFFAVNPLERGGGAGERNRRPVPRRREGIPVQHINDGTEENES